jgi:tetratricopeptide (TPR) repeat protein
MFAGIGTLVRHCIVLMGCRGWFCLIRARELRLRRNPGRVKSMSTRKRIELAVLALLAVVLGVLARLCDLDGNECDNLAWKLVDSGKTEEAVDAFQRTVDRAPNQVAACNNADWLVSYYFEHGRVVDAIAVANRVADVYCGWGLLTKAYLLERMGRIVEAEQIYIANQERYDSDDIVSYPLLGFHYRMARVQGDKDYEPRFQAQLTKIFPRGLEPLPAEMEEGAPKDGVLLDGDSGTLKRAALRGGDIIVGSMDGAFVHSSSMTRSARSGLARVTPATRNCASGASRDTSIRSRTADIEGCTSTYALTERQGLRPRNDDEDGD